MSLKGWRERARFYHYWGDAFSDIPTPYISFSLETYVYGMQPMVFHASNDTNRWRVLVVVLRVSKYTASLELPFWKLPDMVVERHENGRMRNKRLEALAAKRKAKEKTV